MLVGIAAIAASRNACRMSSPATAGHVVQTRTGRNRRRRFQQSSITDIPSDFLMPAASWQNFSCRVIAAFFGALRSIFSETEAMG